MVFIIILSQNQCYHVLTYTQFFWFFHVDFFENYVKHYEAEK